MVGVAGQLGDVGDVQPPVEQGCGTEDVPQAVPGPLAGAIGSTPPGGLVAALENRRRKFDDRQYPPRGAGNISPSGLVPAACSALTAAIRAATISPNGQPCGVRLG